ncbi:unnamed protein product [Sphagnum balticum]
MERLCSEALKVSNCMPQASEFHWTQSQKRQEKELVSKAGRAWAQCHYKLAGQKYEAALRIKPRFELHAYAVFVV